MLRCCDNCPHIDITGKELDGHHSTTSHTTSFHVYKLTERCTVHGRHLLDKKNILTCVYKIRFMCHLQNYTLENRLLLWRHLLIILTKSYTL